MKNVLQDALHLAFMAGKAHEGGEDDRLDPGSRNECRARAERLMTEAWKKLATLPGDVGESARAELARMLAKQAMERGMVRSPGGGMGFLVGSCDCPRDFYAYEKECLDAAKRGENAVELTAAFFLDHCTKVHET